MAASGVDLAELVKDLRRQVTALEDDLRARGDEVDEFAGALRGEYDQAREAGRTAATYGAWRDQRVTQAAAGWVLATAFVRFCEDNGLIEWPFIAGPGDRLADAEERHGAFFREYPQLNDGDWLIAAFDHLASTGPTAARCRRGDQLRLHRRVVGHPLPRRPLPGPQRGRPQDLRTAADPGVRRRVHPRPDPRAGGRGVRARTGRRDPPCRRLRRGCARSAHDRPGLRVRPLPARHLPPAAGQMAGRRARRRRLGADPAVAAVGARLRHRQEADRELPFRPSTSRTSSIRRVPTSPATARPP